MKKLFNVSIPLLGIVLFLLNSCEKEVLGPQPDNLDNYLSQNTLKSATDCDVTTGQINWGSSGVLSSAKAGSYAASVTFNNRAYVFYKGKSSNKVYYTTNIGQSNETEWNIGSGETKEEPAVAVHGGRIYVAYKGKSTNKIYCKYSTAVSSTGYITWSSEFSLSAPRTTIGPAMCSFQGKLYFFYKGESSKSIWWCTLDNHGVDYKIPNGIETNFAPAATATASEIYLLYKGSTSNRSIYMSRAVLSGGTLSWQPEQRFTDDYEKNISNGISYLKSKVFFTTFAKDNKIAYKFGLGTSFSAYNILQLPDNSHGVSAIVLEPNINNSTVVVFFVRDSDQRVCYFRGYLVMDCL
jgi:hypothetical protein